MGTPKDGGPAFPAAEYETEHGDYLVVKSGWEGMSLRDWFAGQIAGHVATDKSVAPFSSSTNPAEVVAGVSYAIADALLRERAKGDKP